jgi:pimeloyl-ACP methyl ester carboxylesterase
MSAAASLTDFTSVDEVDVEDGTLPVAIAGDGPPLILLHGWTLDHRMWEPQLAALGKYFRLIMIDRRGFGRATAPPDLTAEAKDITTVANVLGIDSFALAGLSQGAAVALDFAIRCPTRVSALVLSGTPLPGLVPNADSIPREDYAVLARHGSLTLLRRNWLNHPLMQVGNDEGCRLVEMIVNEYDARDLLAPSALSPFSTAQIAALPMPLLAMAGTEESPWRIACARFLADTAPLGEFVSIAGAGHITNLAQPAAFNRIMLGFLATHFQFSS